MLLTNFNIFRDMFLLQSFEINNKKLTGKEKTDKDLGIR